MLSYSCENLLLYKTLRGMGEVEFIVIKSNVYVMGKLLKF